MSFQTTKLSILYLFGLLWIRTSRSLRCNVIRCDDKITHGYQTFRSIVLNAYRQVDQSWYDDPEFHGSNSNQNTGHGLGSANELSSKSSTRDSSIESRLSTPSLSLIDVEDQSSISLSSSKSFYDLRAKRYCYFERSVSCSSHAHECRVDSRPCNSDRSYLDHMYGTHNFPTVAKINLSPSPKRSIDTNPMSPQPSSNHGTDASSSRSSTNSYVTNDNFGNKEVALSGGSNKKLFNKRNIVSMTLVWIESAAVGIIRVVFNIAATIITLFFIRPIDTANNASFSKPSSSDQR